MIVIRLNGRRLAEVDDAATAYRWLVDNQPHGVAHCLRTGYTVRDEQGHDVLVEDVATNSIRPVTGDVPPRTTRWFE